MDRQPLLKRLRERAEGLEAETYALYEAARDRRVPWYARVVIAAVVAYAVSPIDLIPDFIPVIGYLDDLIIVPGGVFLVLKMIPPGVMQECRSKAKDRIASGRGRLVAAAVVIAIWLLAVFLIVKFVVELLD